MVAAHAYRCESTGNKAVELHLVCFLSGVNNLVGRRGLWGAKGTCLGAGTPSVPEKLLQEHTALLARELDASNAGLAGRCALALGHAGLRKPLVLPLPAESKVRIRSHRVVLSFRYLSN